MGGDQAAHKTARHPAQSAPQFAIPSAICVCFGRAKSHRHGCCPPAGGPCCSLPGAVGRPSFLGCTCTHAAARPPSVASRLRILLENNPSRRHGRVAAGQLAAPCPPPQPTCSSAMKSFWNRCGLCERCCGGLDGDAAAGGNGTSPWATTTLRSAAAAVGWCRA